MKKNDWKTKLGAIGVILGALAWAALKIAGVEDADTIIAIKGLVGASSGFTMFGFADKLQKLIQK